MATRKEELDALRGKQPLPAHRVVQLRAMGMHSIRFEFVVRLLRSGLKVDTLSIYWEQGTEFMLKRELEDTRRKLVLGRRKHVSGSFPDLWLLCYPDDPEIKKSVEQELDRMVRGTRMPARLLEMYEALDDDPVLLLECLARPALVDRLVRARFAFDKEIHAAARHRAQVGQRGVEAGAHGRPSSPSSATPQ